MTSQISAVTSQQDLSADKTIALCQSSGIPRQVHGLLLISFPDSQLPNNKPISDIAVDERHLPDYENGKLPARSESDACRPNYSRFSAVINQENVEFKSCEITDVSCDYLNTSEIGS